MFATLLRGFERDRLDARSSKRSVKQFRRNPAAGWYAASDFLSV
jgi:hypothetical protein